MEAVPSSLVSEVAARETRGVRGDGRWRGAGRSFVCVGGAGAARRRGGGWFVVEVLAQLVNLCAALVKYCPLAQKRELGYCLGIKAAGLHKLQFVVCQLWDS